MAFLENLQQVTWTSPNKDVFTLKTLESGYSQKHIGEVKENPRTSYSASSSSKTKGGKSSASTSSGKKRVSDVNDTFTDLGVGGRDITLDCYFIGENHYTNAASFINALAQTGKSKLQLAYGDEFTVNVISFKVSNNLIQNVNTTVVNVNWHETADTTYPQSTTSKTKEIKNSASTLKDNVAADFSQAVDTIAASTTRLQTFTSNFTSVLNKVSNVLDFADNLTLSTILTDILGQNLSTSALTIASQLGIIFYKAAALTSKVKNLSGFTLADTGLSTLYGGWTSLISTLISNSTTSSSATSLTTAEIDNLMLNDTLATLAITAAAETTIETDYETRAEAVEASKNLVTLFQTWNEFAEDELDKITELENFIIRDGGLQSVGVQAANEILDRSHKLKVEKTVVLAEDKTPLELAYEYYTEDFYSDPDAALEYLITTNNLKDDDFLLLKRGTEVKIYV